MKNYLFYLFAIFIVFQLVIICEKSAISDEQMDHLIEKLGTRDWQSAVDSLVEMGEPVVEPLIAVIESENPALDWHAARACNVLARIKTERAIQVVSQTAVNPNLTKRKRRYAILALGRYNVTTQTDTLITLLQDDDKYIADPAARALGMLGTPKAASALAGIINSRPHYVSIDEIRHTLANDHIDLVAAAAIQSLNTDRYWTWLAVMNGLIDIGESAAPVLIKNINHDDFLTRLRIIRILGRIKSKDSAPILVDALRDENWMIRNEAAVALFKLKTKTAIPRLERMQHNRNLDYAHHDISWILHQLQQL